MRRILLFLLAIAAYWLLRRWRRTQPEKKTPRRGEPDAGGPMVRDRVCNTFLPRSRALVVEEPGETLFFCSEACRVRHTEMEKSR